MKTNNQHPPRFIDTTSEEYYKSMRERREGECGTTVVVKTLTDEEFIELLIDYGILTEEKVQDLIQKGVISYSPAKTNEGDDNQSTLPSD